MVLPSSFSLLPSPIFLLFSFFLFFLLLHPLSFLTPFSIISYRVSHLPSPFPFLPTLFISKKTLTCFREHGIYLWMGHHQIWRQRGKYRSHVHYRWIDSFTVRYIIFYSIEQLCSTRKNLNWRFWCKTIHITFVTFVKCFNLIYSSVFQWLNLSLFCDHGKNNFFHFQLIIPLYRILIQIRKRLFSRHWVNTVKMRYNDNSTFTQSELNEAQIFIQ